MTIESIQSLPYELLIHQNSVRYQQWIIDTIRPYLGKRILELGAGIGNMSRWFTDADKLILTEQDPHLLNLLRAELPSWQLANVKTSLLDISKQTLNDLQGEGIDTIVSFNVLEHVENDSFVLENCVQLLRNSQASKKRIITFVPAHQWAYGVMDKEVGHHRRYNRSMLEKLHSQTAADAKLILLPFNFVGLWGWLVNGRILKRNAAGKNVMNIFETLCPLLRVIDKTIIKGFKIPLGQSLIAIQEWS